MFRTLNKDMCDMHIGLMQLLAQPPSKSGVLQRMFSTKDMPNVHIVVMQLLGPSPSQSGQAPMHALPLA